MNILKNAIKEFQNKNYREAHSLYKEAEYIYGRAIVEANLVICEKFIAAGTPAPVAEPRSQIINKALKKASEGKIQEARTELSSLLKRNESDCDVLIALTKLDILQNRYVDALHKAKIIIGYNPRMRDAYKMAEQACIELKRFEEANLFFLSQPQIVNPDLPVVRTANPSLAPGLYIPAPRGAGNDYDHILAKAQYAMYLGESPLKKVSVIIPTFNRSKLLANTLAAIRHQTYPSELIEIIVVDDGSDDDTFEIVKKYESSLNVRYCRQPDRGFRVAAARNLGLKICTGDAIIFLDADVLPTPNDILEYMTVLNVSDECVLIGHRRYVDTTAVTDDDISEDINVALALPSINPNNQVAGRLDHQGQSFDWRYSVYQYSNYLREDLWPFTRAAGGNLAFSRKLLEAAGLQDEDFCAWGCEDSEYAYRLYLAGAYFIPMMKIVSLHQEPLRPSNKGQEESNRIDFRSSGHRITQEIFARKCPAPRVRDGYRNVEFENPKVSVYIPAYNAERYIIEAVESCLNQTFTDLEVCICDDGSTDGTLRLLKEHYASDRRVRWVSQVNSGIGSATNRAISLARGLYIAQLDADDTLKPEAVAACVKILDSEDVDGVYTDCEIIDADGKFVRNSWCGGIYDVSWMATGMIATHFRMFRRRLWSRISPCNETITNAVDLDLWLKLAERANIKHVHQSLYCYRWHGNNTSIKNRKIQEENHIKVVRDGLARRGLDKFWAVIKTNSPLNPREFKISPKSDVSAVKPENVVVLIPSCEKYRFKRDAIRRTWAKELRNFSFTYFFLAGNPELLSTELVGDTLFVPCEDNYESLLLKLSLGYKFIYEATNFDYVYKIDDDCYPNVHYLIKKILPQLKGKQYLGGAVHPKNAPMNNRWHYGKCSRSEFDKPYGEGVASVAFAKGGYGYFLRRDSLPIIFDGIPLFRKDLDNFNYAPEDVKVAELLSQYKITAHPLEGYSCERWKAQEVLPFVLFDLARENLFYEIDAYKRSIRADADEQVR